MNSSRKAVYFAETKSQGTEIFMGHRVIYYGEHDGARTIRAHELGPKDLDWGVVSPEDSQAAQTEALADAVAVITNGLSITTEMLSKMPNMKLLQVMSAGFDSLDVPAIREMGIEVCNNSPAIARSVAEHAIGMCLTQVEFCGLRQLDDLSRNRLEGS